MDKPEIYLHGFDSKKTICEAFGIDKNTLKNCHVYLAYYHVGDWGCDSSAFVLYEDDKGKLFEVNGSHCSCYGLSEYGYDGESRSQWEPEETCAESLSHRLVHGSLGIVGGYDDEGYASESKLVIDYLQTQNRG